MQSEDEAVKPYCAWCSLRIELFNALCMVQSEDGAEGRGRSQSPSLCCTPSYPIYVHIVAWSMELEVKRKLYTVNRVSKFVMFSL